MTAFFIFILSYYRREAFLSERNENMKRKILACMAIIALMGTVTACSDEEPPTLEIETTTAVVTTEAITELQESIPIEDLPTPEELETEENLTETERAIRFYKENTTYIGDYVESALKFPLTCNDTIVVKLDDGTEFQVTNKTVLVDETKNAFSNQNGTTTITSIVDDGNYYIVNSEKKTVKGKEDDGTNLNFYMDWICTYLDSDYNSFTFTSEEVDYNGKKYTKESCCDAEGNLRFAVYYSAEENKVVLHEIGGEISEFEITHEVDESIFEFPEGYQVTVTATVENDNVEEVENHDAMPVDNSSMEQVNSTNSGYENGGN